MARRVFRLICLLFSESRKPGARIKTDSETDEDMPALVPNPDEEQEADQMEVDLNCPPSILKHASSKGSTFLNALVV